MKNSNNNNNNYYYYYYYYYYLYRQVVFCFLVVPVKFGQGICYRNEVAVLVVLVVLVVVVVDGLSPEIGS